MVGRTICHYRIEAELGRGGMGIVYRAYDARLHRPVAVKVLSEEFAKRTDRRQRILAEARAAAALNHPGITTVYEVGEEGEQLFIVMELVEGNPLRGMIRTGPLELPALVRLGARIAEVLVAAHGCNVVHGDVKPENVIVRADGQLKLLDFGIARQFAAEALTATQSATSQSWLPDLQVVGTLAYMAPEQLRGEPSDARADLFSLGVLLYEMAAGRRPFLGPTARTLIAQILNESPPPLAEGDRIVPAELQRIIKKLLEKHPQSRYQSAREVQVDLNNFSRDLELGTALQWAPMDKKAVAVLPFKLLTPNPEDDYLSVALADTIINTLGTSRKLQVRPTSTVLRYASQAVDPLTTARELNVQVVVDGSIQKLGSRLRVQFQAWSVTEGSLLLSAKHDAEMAELFDLQDRISSELAQALGLPTAMAEPVSPPTQNAAAYELFLRGVERFSRLNRWDLRMAIEMLEEATRLDPRFADAWAHLAQACLQLGMHFEPGKGWTRKAERSARRALALDPKNTQAQCARGKILWTPEKDFRNREALRVLTKAVERNPGCHEAIRYRCMIFYHVGLHERAREGLGEALAANPDDALTLLGNGHVSFFTGDYDRAEDCYARTLALDPANVLVNLFYPLLPLYRQDLSRAEEKLRVARQVAPKDPLVTSCEGLLWAKRGEAHKCREALRRTLQGGKSLTHTHHAWHYAAAAYALLGNSAQAINLLRKAARSGLPNYPLFRDDPHFQGLRNQPQFVRLLADLKRQCEGYHREFGRS